MHFLNKAASLLAVSHVAVSASIEPRQMTGGLPPTPELPAPLNSTFSDSNGASLWLQKFNEQAGGTPIVFIHGGGGYSAYFGDVMRRMIDQGHFCVGVDRRGHGRSTYVETDVWTFDMFANEVYQQLTGVGIGEADWVGWSDGAATTYAALQNVTIARNIRKAFVFAGFMSPDDTNVTYTDTPIYAQFVARIMAEYNELQPDASFATFATLLTTLESTLPQFTADGLGQIDGTKVAVVYADQDEAVKLDVPARLHAAIPNSTLVELTGVSHFAPLQDPEQFSERLTTFLYPPAPDDPEPEEPDFP